MGGATAAGGATATGGATSNGGTRAGGATGSGGLGAGGTQASGGSATGGTTSAGGSTGTTPTAGDDLWLAPTGSDSNAGTEAQPLATLTGAQSKWSAGKTIWLKPGTYAWSSTQKLTKAGTASSPINVFATAGARPVIDFSAQPRDTSSARGIQISGSYWHLKGFDVMKAGDNCIHISGSNNTVEWVTVHECCDSGLQITDAAASNNTILNCDAYGNYDTATGGENADGFAAKLELGPGNVFRGCRSWNNADDGWDLYAAPSVVVIENCWAFLNGKLLSGGGTSNGDGNGFKLGGAGGGAAHKASNCFAFENLACGYTRNNNTEVPTLSQCGGRGDGKGEYCSLTNPSPVSFTMTGSQAKAVQRNADGTLPAIK
jgi:pectate disaccharide-lyase